MKKIIAIVISAVLVLSMSVSAFAALDIKEYNGDYENEVISGELNPVKHETIQEGKAGAPEDSQHWYIHSVSGDEIPTIDGVASETEGYEDFENYEDYLYVITNTGAYDAQAFQDWYNEAKNWNLIVKTCWDGVYLYMYMEYTVKDYVCNVTSGSSLWQWNCIQFGLANLDAIGGERSETGYGVSSRTKQAYTASWGGSYNPVDGEDYQGSISSPVDNVTTVKHEFRVNLKKALNRTENVATGEAIRMCWVIMTDNLGRGDGQRGVSFGHGITGVESGKFAEHYCVVNLVGAVSDIEEEEEIVHYTPDDLDEDLEYYQTGSIYFEEIAKINDFFFEDSNSSATMSEDKQYITLTTTEASTLYQSLKRFPTSLWANNASYAVIKYRTNSEGMQLGLNFVNSNMRSEVTDEETGETYSEKYFHEGYEILPMDTTPIIADGEWHYAIYQLNSAPCYVNILEKIAFYMTTGTIDIEGVMFYGWDPSEKYDPNYVLGDDDDDDDDDDDESPVASTPSTVESAEESKPVDDKPVKKKGCKSMACAGAALVVVASMAGGALMLRKKED